jgi:hypothetical protein
VIPREPSSEDVAEWMLGEVARRGRLFQVDALEAILERFGPSFIFRDDNGIVAIRPKVLKAFRDLSGDDVTWSRRWKYWEGRGTYPGSRPSSPRRT